MFFRKHKRLVTLIFAAFMLISCSACSQKPTAEELAKELPRIEALNRVKFPKVPATYIAQVSEDGTIVYRVDRGETE